MYLSRAENNKKKQSITGNTDTLESVRIIPIVLQSSPLTGKQYLNRCKHSSDFCGAQTKTLLRGHIGEALKISHV